MKNQALTQQEINDQTQAVFRNGAPTISLRHFVDRLLAEYLGPDYALDAAIKLIEDCGLEITDKVIEGNMVSSGDLVAALRLRQQEADDNVDNDGFDFWQTLTKEGRYSIFRDDLAKAYHRAGKTRFPWLDLNGALVKLANANSPIDTTLDFAFNCGGMLEGINQAIGSGLITVDYRYWLTVPQWTREEAACLVCGIDPDYLGTLKSCTDYIDMRKPLINLIRLLPDQSQPPLAWLALIENLGYLVGVAPSLMAWYDSQPKPKVKVRKKLTPLARETTESLLLIYAVCKHYQVEYLDKMSAKTAWGRIINRDYPDNDNLIRSISEVKTFIIMNSGEKLDKQDFQKKYSSRFS